MTVDLTIAHRDRPEQPVDLVAAELAAVPFLTGLSS